MRYYDPSRYWPIPMITYTLAIKLPMIKKSLVARQWPTVATGLQTIYISCIFKGLTALVGMHLPTNVWLGNHYYSHLSVPRV